MFKNVAGQTLTMLVIDTVGNSPKSGDAANLTAYVSKDDGAVTPLADSTATEIDPTNALGLYNFDLTQAETNGNKLLFSGKSSTLNVIMVPILLYTESANSAVAIGPGATPWTTTIEDVFANPLSNVDVWISTDSAGVDIVAGTLQTEDDGTVTFMLDSGVTYFMWRRLAGYNFPNPTAFQVP